MKARRIHLLGASGSGTSTLGAALAKSLGLRWIDADDIFWERTEPPYTTKRPVPERVRMLEEIPESSWVISGSMTGWGDVWRAQFTHVIFLSLPQKKRIARLRERERFRYGDRLLPGGDMHSMHREFIDWAKLYDTGGREVRSRVLHEYWMRSLPCPVLRIDGQLPTETQVANVLAELDWNFVGKIEVTVHPGIAAASVVEPFYHGLGRTNTFARPEDIFFVARSGETVLGAVRYCVEERVSLLRGMLIAERARRKGIGQILLAAFDRYLLDNKIAPIYCVPHEHLRTFYKTIGFADCPPSESPPFLAERVLSYRAEGMTDAILMVRRA